MAKTFSIADLRRELGLSLEEFGKRIGLSSKGNVSLIERGQAAPSLPVALAIEKLSCGRIDAAALNSDVAAARAANVVTCGTCDRRADQPEVDACTASNCGLRQKEAA